MLKPFLKVNAATERCCIECKQELTGRSDKKFCDDACRTAYHNRLQDDEVDKVRLINSILRKNRRVLRYFHTRGELRISKAYLRQTGFTEGYLTSQRKVGKEIYHYIYEFGFLEVSKEEVLLVKSTEEPFLL